MSEGPAIAAAIAWGHTRLIARLHELSDEELLADSSLPDWSRLTVVCHIRFGAEAINRIVTATVAGEEALFYPGGRAEQRPGTLFPESGETPRDVVASFADRCDELDATLADLSDADWAKVSREPDGKRDLGPQTVEQLAILRLTELDVHAVDMHIGITEWSETFARVGLPLRIDRLGKFLSNNPAAPERPDGSWLVRADDGRAYRVTSNAGIVTTRVAEWDERADGVIDGSSRDLIALMLGRELVGEINYSNDFAKGFAAAFPGP